MKLIFGTFLAFFASNVLAQSPKALVSSLKGDSARAFMFTDNGKVKNIKVGDIISAGEQLMVEIGSQLTFKHYNNDSYYHMTGGSQVLFEENAIDLVRGSVWVQSEGAESKRSFVMKSANAFARYSNTDFIFNYDTSSGRSQILVLNGEVDFGNIKEPLNTVNVLSGKVSQVDKKLLEGLPRNPELVGTESYHQAVSAFKGITTSGSQNIARLAAPKQGRVIASVSDGPKILFIDSTMKTTRVPASADSVPSAMDYYVEQTSIKPSLSVKANKKVVIASTAPVRVFGAKLDALEAKREIASIAPVVEKVEKPVIVKREIASEKAMLLDDIDAAFVGSLEKHEKSQKKYSPERIKLIKELESVSQQFHKEY